MIEEKKDFYINGNWVKPSQINDLEVIDPSNEEVCAVISLGSEKDTNDAVKAAKDSFELWWGISKEEKLLCRLGSKHSRQTWLLLEGLRWRGQGLGAMPGKNQLGVSLRA